MRDVLDPTTITPGTPVGVVAFRGGFTEAIVDAVTPHTNHLGGRWVILDVTLPDGETTTVDSRAHVLLGPERPGSEVTEEGHYEHGVEVAYSSGPGWQGPARIVGPAPGAPYAGPGRAVATSTRTRDLAAADRRQAQIDADQ